MTGVTVNSVVDSIASGVLFIINGSMAVVVLVICLDSILSVVHAVFSESDRNNVVWQELADQVDKEDGKGKTNGSCMLFPAESVRVEAEDSSGVGDTDLSKEDEEPDEDEGKVAGQSVENVDLVVDFSGTDHVPDLHEDEEVEDPGHVTGVAISFEVLLVEWLIVPIVSSSWEDAVSSVHAAAIIAVSPLRIGLRNDELAEEDECINGDAHPDGHDHDMLDHLS